MKIDFISEGSRPASAEKNARRGVEAVLKREGVSARRPLRTAGGRKDARRALNIVWTTREKIRNLNRRFRGKNRFTDVIAFRYETQDGFRLPEEKGDVFGDIYISPAQAEINARRFGVSLHEELVRLAIHGTLHLLGYTDYVPREKKKMWAVQESVLRRVLS